MDTHGLTSSLSCVAEAPSDTQLEQPTGGSASPPLLGSAQTEAESRHRHLSAFQQSWKSIRRGDFNIFINCFGLWGLKSDCKKMYSRQITHSIRVPHKQILAIVRLQHKLRDADTCWRVTVEPYCGWNIFVLCAATLRLRRHYHIQISSWWKNKNTLRCCDH